MLLLPFILNVSNYFGINSNKMSANSTVSKYLSSINKHLTNILNINNLSKLMLQYYIFQLKLLFLATLMTLNIFAMSNINPMLLNKFTQIPYLHMARSCSSYLSD